ncbi:hypothetical protein PSPO01_12693 [Paraphaeosphaeria sporulosa]
MELGATSGDAIRYRLEAQYNLLPTKVPTNNNNAALQASKIALPYQTDTRLLKGPPTYKPSLAQHYRMDLQARAHTPRYTLIPDLPCLRLAHQMAQSVGTEQSEAITMDTATDMVVENQTMKQRCSCKLPRFGACTHHVPGATSEDSSRGSNNGVNRVHNSTEFADACRYYHLRGLFVTTKSQTHDSRATHPNNGPHNLSSPWAAQGHPRVPPCHLPPLRNPHMSIA